MINFENHNELSMTVLMTPDMANFSGKVHGGALLDQVAYACASRYSVTLSVASAVQRADSNRRTRYLSCLHQLHRQNVNGSWN
jgi:acyl-CoA hydrolase